MLQSEAEYDLKQALARLNEAVAAAIAEHNRTQNVPNWKAVTDALSLFWHALSEVPEGYAELCRRADYVPAQTDPGTPYARIVDEILPALLSLKIDSPRDREYLASLSGIATQPKRTASLRAECDSLEHVLQIGTLSEEARGELERWQREAKRILSKATFLGAEGCEIRFHKELELLDETPELRPYLLEPLLEAARSLAAWCERAAAAAGDKKARQTETPARPEEARQSMQDDSLSRLDPFWRGPPFSWEYGSDLHCLWGWGARLGARMEDDRPPSESIWMLFRPDVCARDAMMRFSVGYPHVVKQIDEYLSWAEARYADFLAADNDTTRAELADALCSLCERIKVGVETIARTETPAGGATRKWTKETANVEVDRLLRQRKNKPKERTSRKLAEAIGCSEPLVRKTAAWIAYQKKAKERKPTKPKAVSLSGKVLASKGADDPELEQLIAEQQTDFEESPLVSDARKHRRRPTV